MSSIQNSISQDKKSRKFGDYGVKIYYRRFVEQISEMTFANSHNCSGGLLGVYAVLI